MREQSVLRRRFLRSLGGTGAVAVAGCVGLLGEDDPEDNTDHPNANDTTDPANEPDDTLPSAESVDVDRIAADPTDLPPPVEWDEPRHHEWTLTSVEAVAEIEPGVTTRFMTYEGQIPGPFYRIRVGDTVHLTFEVPADRNDDVHNVDFHAVYGPGGGAVDTTIAPGDQPAEIQFQAMYPGAHIYHCAPGLHDYHISSGMFGIILVEPENGLPPVDREFYVGQHELYTDGKAGQAGHHSFRAAAAADEDPTYVLLNGEVGALTDDGHGAMQAAVGETVRVYWANGGPNLVSGPHPIGNVWSRWYRDGDVLSEPARFIEGVAQPAGTVAFGEMDMKVPGPVFLVDHALSRVVHKGLVATINVEGDPDPDIFDPDP